MTRAGRLSISGRPVRLCSEEDRMRTGKIFYGWVIVGSGFVVTCIGMGAMLSLSIFLQPMSEAMGWSRTGISIAALLTWLGMGVGSFLWGALSDRLGTRTVVLCGGVLLVREPAVVVGGASAVTAGADGREFTAAQVFRTPQFAAIAFTYFACCAAHSGPIFHMVTNVMDHGVSAMAATTVLSVAGLASLGGKIVCGLIADRVGAKRTLVVGLAIQALSLSLYLFTRELGSFYALAVMFGFAYGGVMPLYAILVREYFGARVMGTAFGAVALVSTLGMAVGPWAGGWLYDTFGSYSWLFVASSGIGLGAVAIAATFRAPPAAAAALAAPGPAPCRATR